MRTTDSTGPTEPTGSTGPTGPTEPEDPASSVMKIVCVAGARPNYMKIKPVMDALERRGAEVVLVHTGQHYDDAMNEVFFRDLGIRPPDRFLGVGSGSHAEQTGRVMTAFEPLLQEVAPDAVVVVGDINSTLACALVTAKAGPLLAHVEAGLRSRDWGMPEEVNRVATDRVSDYLLAPSPDAADNLRAEGYRDDQIHVVGNVMIDTLLANLERARRSDVLERHGLTPKGYGLVTLHRPANVDDPAILAGLLKALGEIAAHCPLLLPVHPRAAGRLAELGVPGGIRLVPPAGYLDFIALQDSARVVLTDSGGVQEETTALGVPCVTLRDNTERPITVEQGTNVLAGRDPDRIVATTARVLAQPPAARRPELWDGRASERIADVLLEGGTARTRRRPTDMLSTTQHGAARGNFNHGSR
ncbi:UDP-N-acetylglucosamine 2-epimerase (non-hydrolysing) [Streptomyces sp. DvalAA-14]|uniref:non-hydrolyzing UDP-N-acetylglucosamine 2-epimerase n=1 Tax=unclassified Streptomyces TaxID=2593676 RepID=UPI00081AEBE1|nr:MULTISPECIES: UDP-N-acetylglucosamine 2-epimerase (non-hydrolyzing) [unclassified Streptomyces]SCD34223.1 UDP-N-acetylglucosamine 2-epimerase (non-hydrolysing) [Streptomyces sp. DvalAA-14]